LDFLILIFFAWILRAQKSSKMSNEASNFFNVIRSARDPTSLFVVLSLNGQRSKSVLDSIVAALLLGVGVVGVVALLGLTGSSASGLASELAVVSVSFVSVIVLLATTSTTTTGVVVGTLFSFFAGLLLGVVSALGQLGSEFFFALLLLFNGESGTAEDIFLGLVGTTSGGSV
jgi:hypothetical protein